MNQCPQGQYTVTKWIHLNLWGQCLNLNSILLYIYFTDVCNAECCHIHNNHTKGIMRHGNVILCGSFSERVSGISNVSELLVEHVYVCNNDSCVTFCCVFSGIFATDIDIIYIHTCLAFWIVTFGAIQQLIIDHALRFAWWADFCVKKWVKY